MSGVAERAGEAESVPRGGIPSKGGVGVGVGVGVTVAARVEPYGNLAPPLRGVTSVAIVVGRSDNRGCASWAIVP
jgi:hypothetical protein